MIKGIIILGVYCCIISCNLTLKETDQYLVIKIVDGDTIHVKQREKLLKIRLYGIDTPEKNQNYGLEATEFMKSIIFNKIVNIKILNKDYYGRSVAILQYDNVNIGSLLLKNGLAWVNNKYCKKSICNEWIILEKTAKQEKIGLWNEQNPIPPWEWRKMH